MITRIYLGVRKVLNGYLIIFGFVWVAKFKFERATKVRTLLRFFQSLWRLDTEHKLIRVGSSGDGGYLIPDILNEIEAVISPGLGDEYSLENFFASRSIPVLSIDASVSAPVGLHQDVTFLQKYLAPSYVKSSVHVSLESVVNDCLSIQSNQIFLQCDIEGAEWEVFADLNSDILQRFSLIVLELHNLDRVLERNYALDYIIPTLQALLAQFHVLHLHPNNAGDDFYFLGRRVPELLEITLLRKDMVQNVYGQINEANPLDKPNVKGIPIRGYKVLNTKILK